MRFLKRNDENRRLFTVTSARCLLIWAGLELAQRSSENQTEDMRIHRIKCYLPWQFGWIYCMQNACYPSRKTSETVVIRRNLRLYANLTLGRIPSPGLQFTAFYCLLSDSGGILNGTFFVTLWKWRPLCPQYGCYSVATALLNLGYSRSRPRSWDPDSKTTFIWHRRGVDRSLYYIMESVFWSFGS